MSLKIENLNKTFDGINLFKDFNIEIKPNTISCILGPSGCGKTTLLNMISGSIKPDSGILSGFDKMILSYIFQDPRLLPWKTVKENISFVTKDSDINPNLDTLVEQYIRLVNLEDFTNYYPSKLSGGMKQRVAIARAFSYPSDLILMDEPLKALDLKLKLNLINAFRKIWQLDKRTVIFVTHDIEEALLLGNEIFIFSNSPVEIIKQFSISNTLKSRDLNSKDLFQLKQEIFNIIN